MADSQESKLAAQVLSKWQDSGIAESYARAENATRPFAQIMAKKADLSKIEGKANILDLACGTGAVTAAIYEALPKERWNDVKVLAGDISQNMLAYLKTRAEEAGWITLETKIVDANNIELEKDSFTHLFASFGLFMFPLSTLAVCHSLLRPGGFFATSSWACIPWYPLVARAVSCIPNAPPCPSEEEMTRMIHKGNPWNKPEFVASALRDAGFVDVETVIERTRADTGTPDQFVDTMFMPLQMFTAKWDKGKREELLEVVTKELRKQVVEMAGGEDGHFVMEFEGIVGMGRRPE